MDETNRWNQHVVQVSLIVKAEDHNDAERIVEEKLGNWMMDAPIMYGKAPYPNGTLLHYSVKPRDIGCSVDSIVVDEDKEATIRAKP